MAELPTIDDIRATFELLYEWDDRYRYVIELGEQLPPMDPVLQSDANRVHGCVSKVWIIARAAPGSDVLEFSGDSDASIVKGLVAILASLYSGKTPDEIARVDADRLFSELGLYDHLSPTRHVGVYAMVEKIKSIAAAYAESASPAQPGIATTGTASASCSS